MHFCKASRLSCNLFCLPNRFFIDPGNTGVDVGCIVTVQRHHLVRENLDVVSVCQADMDRSLLGEDEQLVSNIVRIRTNVDVTVSAWSRIPSIAKILLSSLPVLFVLIYRR